MPMRRPAQLADATGATGPQTANPPESVTDFRLRVRAHLAEFKPAGSIATGRVVVTFTLSKGGDVNSAEILRSSGEAELDESALAAVHRAAPFPKTPPGLCLTNCRFVVPFLFGS